MVIFLRVVAFAFVLRVVDQIYQGRLLSNKADITNPFGQLSIESNISSVTGTAPGSVVAFLLWKRAVRQ
jgi:hypothetical protein